MATPTRTPTPSRSPAFANNEHWSQSILFKEARLDDAQACTWWCIEQGILARSRVCWKCKKMPSLSTREDWMSLQWPCPKCMRQKEVTVGSVFEGSKLPLPKALMLALCYAQGARLESARLAAPLSRGDPKPALSTTCNWFAFLRAKVATAWTEGLSQIGGPGIRVQVDEALLGRRKYNRGRVMRGTWVLGMIAEDGDARFEVVPNRSADVLVPVIQRLVKPGSIIVTDEWRSYRRLGTLGYEHATVNHSVEFVSREGYHTQRIEAQWRVLRRKFTRGGIRHDDSPTYLAEYCWRQECKLRGASPFDGLLQLLRV